MIVAAKRCVAHAVLPILLAPLGALGATLAPGSLDFGGQSMATSSPALPVTFTNDSGASIAVNSISVSSPQFVQTHNCPPSLGAGASCVIQVVFLPAVAAGAINSTAAVNGSLTVAHGGAGSPHSTSLAGLAEKSLVTHYYRSILRRAPDAGGKAFWTSEVERVPGLGANVNEAWYAMAQQFYFSAEYTGFGRDDTGFVTDLYTTFFNRVPDVGGLNFWVSNLQQGLPREVLLASFMFSPEFSAFTQAIFGNTAARAEVDMVMDFYRGLLSRLPDTGGLNYWVGRFQAAQCQGAGAVAAEAEAISSAFALSGEYLGRARSNGQYVGDLYNSFLRRGGDLGGVQFWVNDLNTGVRTREQVRVAFVGTPEFSQRIGAVVAQGCQDPPLDCAAANVLCVGGPQSEYATIQAAITAANPAAGKTVLVFDGNYAGFRIPNNRSGTSVNRFAVRAQGSNANITSANSDGNGATASNANYVTIQGFNVSNMPQHGIGCHDASSTAPMTGVIIRNNTAMGNGVSNIYCSNATNTLIEGNTCGNAQAEHGIYVPNAGADSVTIRGNVLFGNERNGLHTNGDSSVGGDGLQTGLVIEDNVIYGNNDNAMDLDGLYDSTIRNNLIYDNGHHGIRVFRIDAAAGAGNLRIYNNTIVIPTPSNSGSAIKLTDDIGGHTIFNNILVNLGTSGTIVVGNSNFKSDYNIVVNSGFSVNEGSTLLNFTQWKALPGGYDANSTVSTTTALFADYAGKDFRLKAGSPAANTGVGAFNGVSAPAEDIANVGRPQGVAFDRGAYESF